MNIIDETRENRDMLDRIEQLEALLDVTQHALEFALKRLEKTSAGWVKEIEAHRNTTHKLVALQQEALTCTIQSKQ